MSSAKRDERSRYGTSFVFHGERSSPYGFEITRARPNSERALESYVSRAATSSPPSFAATRALRV